LGSAIASSVLRSIGHAKLKEAASVGDENDRTTNLLLRKDLVRWFKKNDRKFPWRYSNLNAWQVLLIEMCLHLTKADQVAEVAQEILEFGFSPDQFLKNTPKLSPKIATLELHWRAENLAQAAMFIRDNLNGVVPKNWQELRAIPGVGDYIASAVLCFANDLPTVLIDTNTTRIARRVLGCNSDSPVWRLRLALLRMAGPKGPNQEWNYGLLDLGALVCTARSPKCGACPIEEHCSTGRSRLRSST